MTQSPAQIGLGKMLRVNYLLINRVILPLFICFFSISLFLFLSYVIIERCTIVQMASQDRDVAIIKILKD